MKSSTEELDMRKKAAQQREDLLRDKRAKMMTLQNYESHLEKEIEKANDEIQVAENDLWF